MEQISKREFYAKYAHKQDKMYIRSAAILAYVCAAITLAVGLLLENYFILIDVAIIVGMALGVQIAKSRVCAVILLIYSCVSMIITLVITGKVTGWWLICVGICAVLGTFHVHKDYQRYLLSNQSEPANRQSF